MPNNINFFINNKFYTFLRTVLLYLSLMKIGFLYFELLLNPLSHQNKFQGLKLLLLLLYQESSREKLNLS